MLPAGPSASSPNGLGAGCQRQHRALSPQECIMGLREQGRSGCILADEMVGVPLAAWKPACLPAAWPRLARAGC
jgi:hypothetical protein